MDAGGHMQLGRSKQLKHKPKTQGKTQIPHFFPSRLADVALRLGPYMSISSQKDICTRTQEVHQSWQIPINQKNTRPTPTTTCKSPSQICVSSRENSKPDKKTGQGPNKKTTTTKICQRTQRIYHCATPQKPAK